MKHWIIYRVYWPESADPQRRRGNVGCTSQPERMRKSQHRRSYRKGRRAPVNLAWHEEGEPVWETLETLTGTKDEAWAREEHHARKLGTLWPDGLNLQAGHFCTEELGRQKGLAWIGRKPTDEHRRKISEAHRGKKKTHEARANMSRAQRRMQRERVASGEAHFLKGREFSPEHRANMSASFRASVKHKAARAGNLSRAVSASSLMAAVNRLERGMLATFSPELL